MDRKASLSSFIYISHDSAPLQLLSASAIQVYTVFTDAFIIFAISVAGYSSQIDRYSGVRRIGKRAKRIDDLAPDARGRGLGILRETSDASSIVRESGVARRIDRSMSRHTFVATRISHAFLMLIIGKHRVRR